LSWSISSPLDWPAYAGASSALVGQMLTRRALARNLAHQASRATDRNEAVEDVVPEQLL
jgi:hypothetical protein